MLAPSAEAAAARPRPPGPLFSAANQKAVRALTFCAVARNLGIMIRMQTETEIWLRAYAGDFAAQAGAQGALESISGVIDFVVSPILGGLSDAIGRKPLMVMSPAFSVATSALLTFRPTVSSLVVRRLLMCFSSTPWHSGEAAALADMFKHDAGAYGTAKSWINSVGAVMQVVCPIAGSYLAQISLRLPWAICGGAFAVMVAVAVTQLQETLPLAERVPWTWKGSNPLAFTKLFCSGAKMRLLALCTVWGAVGGGGSGGRSATHRYEELHRQQMLGWGMAARGRFSSFGGLLSIPASAISGALLRWVGTRRSLLVGQLSTMAEQLSTAAASTGAHFYLIRPIRLTADVATVAMSYATTALGVQAGIPMGELNSSLSNLRVICRIGSPWLWGRIYTYGIARGVPTFFLFVSAAAGAVQLGLLGILTAGVELDRRAAS
jgi:DHA1 family tetracycline resistance protein-like MFS transporter